MQTRNSDINKFRGILERKETELAYIMRKRDGIAIEKSADEMDEIQYASERDLAIRNVDRDSTPWRESSVRPDSRRQLWNLHRMRIGDKP